MLFHHINPEALRRAFHASSAKDRIDCKYRLAFIDPCGFVANALFQSFRAIDSDAAIRLHVFKITDHDS